MAEKEREIMVPRLLSLQPNERLFRINCGVGWVGKIAKKTPNMIILKNPRPLHAAPKGWGDLVGWTEIEITPDMVGQKIAVFTMEEIKAGNDTMKKDQLKFQEIITRMGGIYRILTGNP